MEKDILERLDDLRNQATTERSHNYVANCAKDAVWEIVRLRTRVQVLESELRDRRGAA